MIERIRRRYNRKTGCVAVTFELSGEAWKRLAAGSMPPLDFVAGTLNMALLELEPVQGER